MMPRNVEPNSRNVANNSRFAAPGLRNVATSQIPFDPTRDFSQSQPSQQQNNATFRNYASSNFGSVCDAVSRGQNLTMQNTVGQQEREFRSVFGQRGNNGGNLNRVRSFGESLENENGITGRTNATANTNSRGFQSMTKQRPEGQRLAPPAAASISKRLFDGPPGPATVAGSIWDRDKATAQAQLQRQALERAAQFQREKSGASNSQSLTGPPAKEFYNAGADHYVSSQSTTVWTNNTQDSTNNTQALPFDVDRLVAQITAANSANLQEALESLQRQLQTDFVDLLRECVGGFQQQLEGVLGEQSETVTEKMQQLMDECGAMQPGVKSLLEGFATKLEEASEARMGDVVKSFTAFGQRWTEQQEVLVKSMFKKALGDEFSADVASKVKNQIASPIACLSQKLQTEFDLLKQHSGQQLSSALSRLVDQIETRLGGKIRQSAADIEISIARSISRQGSQLETLISSNLQATTENTAQLSNAMVGLKSSLKEAVVLLNDQKSAGTAAKTHLEQKNASSQQRQDDARKRVHCFVDSPGSESETSSVLSAAAFAKPSVAGGLRDDDPYVFSDDSDPKDDEESEEAEVEEEEQVEGMSEDETETNPFDAFDFI